jgi:ethanolamine kinase
MRFFRIGEMKSHASLALRGLAPPLLARFQNGLLYRFVRGQVATPDLLIQAPVWRGVARRLAQWHALLPAKEPLTADPIEVRDLSNGKETNGYSPMPGTDDEIIPITLKEPGPSLWSVLQKWILALPATTKEQRSRRKVLQKELERIVGELDIESEIGTKGVCGRSTPGWKTRNFRLTDKISWCSPTAICSAQT